MKRKRLPKPKCPRCDGKAAQPLVIPDAAESYRPTPGTAAAVRHAQAMVDDAIARRKARDSGEGRP